MHPGTLGCAARWVPLPEPGAFALLDPDPSTSLGPWTSTPITTWAALLATTPPPRIPDPVPDRVDVEVQTLDYGSDIGKHMEQLKKEPHGIASPG